MFICLHLLIFVEIPVQIFDLLNSVNIKECFWKIVSFILLYPVNYLRNMLLLWAQMVNRYIHSAYIK